MLVAVKAWEGMYQGLHGIEDFGVIEVSDNKDEALREIDDWGSEASEELIYQFGLEEDYFDLDEDDEIYDITDSPYYEGRGWCAYEIKEGVNLSQEKLDVVLYHLGFDLFIAEYCKSEPFYE